MGHVPEYCRDRYAAEKEMRLRGWREGTELRHKKSGAKAVLGVKWSALIGPRAYSIWVLVLGPRPRKGLVEFRRLLIEFEDWKDGD